MTVSIFNTGIVPSYVNEIRFCGIIDGKVTCFNTSDKWDEDGAGILREDLGLKNPDFGTPVEPGRKQIYYFHFSDFNQGRERHMIPTDAYISDEIGNEYREVFPHEIKHRIQAYFDKEGKIGYDLGLLVYST